MSSPKITTEMVTVKVSDGTEMGIFVARPANLKNGEKAPGIMVLQEAFGVNAHMRDVTTRFAELGYVAVSPEFFHRTAPTGFEGNYADFSSIMPHMQAVTPAALEADLQATYAWLRLDTQTDGKQISSIGYCMGGRATWVANSLFPLKTAVSYYGGRIAPDLLPLAEKQHAPILLIWGGLDKHIGPEQREAIASALRNAGKPYTNVEFSYGDHGFFCDDRPVYNDKAAREAWALTLAFLESNV